MDGALVEKRKLVNSVRPETSWFKSRHFWRDFWDPLRHLWRSHHGIVGLFGAKRARSGRVRVPLWADEEALERVDGSNGMWTYA